MAVELRETIKAKKAKLQNIRITHFQKKDKVERIKTEQQQNIEQIKLVQTWIDQVKRKTDSLNQFIRKHENKDIDEV